MTKPSHPTLHVCITCTAGQGEDATAEPPGARLLSRLHAARAERAEKLELQAVSCLAACARGCTAAIFMPGKNFFYLLGHLRPEQAEDLLEYAGLYAASPTGAVMPSRRALSLRDAIIGRFPAHAAPHPQEAR